MRLEFYPEREVELYSPPRKNKVVDKKSVVIDAAATRNKEVSMKYIYPAIFTKEKEVIVVRFPDLDGCVTYGDDIKMAYDMAVEALTGYLESVVAREKIPTKASDPFEIDCPKDSIVSPVSCEVNLAKQTKSIKKTLTIPVWLNDLAVERNISFSQVLQEALIAKLQDHPNV